MTTDTTTMMRAVVFKGTRKVTLEDRPIPKIQDAGDIIVKVTYTALCGRWCGSELHVFRGHQPSPIDFIMGHEFTGTVHEVGDAVKSVKKGDHMVRVPLADGTVVKAPEGLKDQALVMMADIFPTGFFAASNGFKELSKEQISEATVAVIGCGPVGLCAVIAAANFNPKNLFAIDSIPSRLELAKSLGAEPLNFQTDREALDARIKEVTDGRGADVVLEVVGLSPALKLGYDLLRPWGIMSSVGVHNAEIPWSGNQAYGKNLRVQMGRCPVRSIFPQALELLKQKQDQLGFMADKIMPLSQAVEGYDLFDNMKVQKVIFEAQK
ncbi:MAG: hypothetical protein M1837_002975 [Sclerophora amabilis]|nr:MAG: hypothetical protein M1837_002975 [Sclerophora amabilis]